MKTKPLFLFLIFSLSAAAAFAQSVQITSKKTTYTRPKPLMEFKKTFTVNRPIVKAATPALSKKIQDAISYERVVSLNIQDEKTEAQWLEEADYQVDYNKNGILSVGLSMSGTGAYPSVYTKTVVVNSKTGTIVKPADVFTNLRGLAAAVKKYQQKEIKESIAEIKKDKDFNEPNPETLFEDDDFTVENLGEFTVSDRGVIFNYDYGFPHVILALEPSGSFLLTWKELKPFIKPAGLFGQFAK